MTFTFKYIKDFLDADNWKFGRNKFFLAVIIGVGYEFYIKLQEEYDFDFVSNFSIFISTLIIISLIYVLLSGKKPHLDCYFTILGNFVTGSFLYYLELLYTQQNIPCYKQRNIVILLIITAAETIIAHTTSKILYDNRHKE